MNLLESLERVFEPAHPGVNTAEDVANLFAEYVGDCPQEVFLVLTMNQRNQPLALRAVHVGGLNSAAIDQRCIFRTALVDHAVSIVVGHNHPSGDVSPSQEDIEVTKCLAESGKLLGVEVLDHVIIGTRNGLKFQSLKRQGVI